MLVRKRMTRNPVTTSPNASVPDALKVMQGSRIRQLPVLDEKDHMVGIVSLVDLFRASPSPATSLSIWEIDYLLEKIKVSQVMTRDVITITEDTAVEDAGRIMAENAVSGLPVMRDGELVGIITESHLFNVLVDVFGARQCGVRVTAQMPMEKGGLAKLSGAVAAIGGNFVAFTESMAEGTVTFKVRDVERDQLVRAIEPLVTNIADVRETVC
jgi:acetoin utilization protein AcuB